MQTQQKVKKMEIDEDQEIIIDEVINVDTKSFEDYQLKERLARIRDQSILNEPTILIEEIEYLTTEIENGNKIVNGLYNEKITLKNGLKEIKGEIEKLNVHIKNENSKVTLLNIKKKEKIDQLDTTQKTTIVKKQHKQKEEKAKNTQFLKNQKNIHVTGQCDNIIKEKKCTKKVYVSDEHGYNLCCFCFAELTTAGKLNDFKVTKIS
jgi:predicted nuclease with TOPRIM domain